MTVPVRYMNRLISKCCVTFFYFILPMQILFLVFFATILLFTKLFWLPVAYIIWAVYSDRLQFMPHELSNSLVQKHNLWKFFINYFPIKLHVIDSKMFSKITDRNYLLLHHSFGPQNVPTKLAIATNALNWLKRTEYFKSYMAVNPQFFRIPYCRDLAFALGFVNDSLETFRNIFAEPNTNKIVTVSLKAHLSTLKSGEFDMKRHTEIFRIALKYGVSLVPILCLGEQELFQRFHLSKLIKNQSFLPTWIYYGCGFFLPCGILPFRKPVRVIVGQEIEVEKTDQYDNKDVIDELVNRYTEQLNDLYEQEKNKI